MSKITLSIRLEPETVELLKIAAMQEGLHRGNYDLSYTDLIEEAIDTCYSQTLLAAANKVKFNKNLSTYLRKNDNEEGVLDKLRMLLLYPGLDDVAAKIINEKIKEETLFLFKKYAKLFNLSEMALGDSFESLADLNIESENALKERLKSFREALDAPKVKNEIPKAQSEIHKAQKVDCGINNPYVIEKIKGMYSPPIATLLPFAEATTRLFQRANHEAQRFNHEYVGTEHVLLAVVREGSHGAYNILSALHCNMPAIRLELEKLLQSGPPSAVPGKLPQTPRVRKVVEYAMEEARLHNHDHLRTEHVLAGLVREVDGLAGIVLKNAKVTLEKVRREIPNLNV